MQPIKGTYFNVLITLADKCELAEVGEGQDEDRLVLLLGLQDLPRPWPHLGTFSYLLTFQHDDHSIMEL